jgi:hypothetical protein
LLEGRSAKKEKAREENINPFPLPKLTMYPVSMGGT